MKVFFPSSVSYEKSLPKAPLGCQKTRAVTARMALSRWHFHLPISTDFRQFACFIGKPGNQFHHLLTPEPTIEISAGSLCHLISAYQFRLKTRGREQECKLITKTCLCWNPNSWVEKKINNVISLTGSRVHIPGPGFNRQWCGVGFLLFLHQKYLRHKTRI